MAISKQLKLSGLFFLLGIFIHPVQSQTQVELDRIYSIPELQTDFKVLRNRYESRFTNLELYHSAQQVQLVFDSLYQHITPMNAREFYSYICTLNSFIKDGHSHLLPDTKTSQYHYLNSLYLPFDIYVNNKSLFIKANYTGNLTIPVGAEIQSINGLKSADIYEFMMNRQVRDGLNEQYALWILNHYFKEYYSFYFGHPNKYQIQVNTGTGKSHFTTLDGLTNIQIDQNKLIYSAPTIKNVFESPNFRVKYDTSENVAIITIKTWEYPNLKSEIKMAFEEIGKQGINNLIVDIRDNQGGNFKPAIYLCSYLLNQPFKYYLDVKSVRRNNKGQRKFRSKKSFLLKTFFPVSKPFKGKVYVLINGGTFSNSTAFSSCLANYKRAVFVGEETGGDAVISSGVFSSKAYIELPNTHIQCENSNYQLHLNSSTSHNGRGLLPDYQVQSTLDDVIMGHDPVMEKTRSLIQSNREQ
ncbi:MAG TPA: S41 family peptidase [Flavobacteriales bacterium]|nr:S41 family peptidase [Flavobacteriales bacterium]